MKRWQKMYKLNSVDTETEVQVQEYFMVQVGNHWTMPPLSSSGRPCDNLTDDFRQAICYRDRQKGDLFEPRFSMNKAYRDADKFGGKIVRATLKFEVTDRQVGLLRWFCLFFFTTKLGRF